MRFFIYILCFFSVSLFLGACQNAKYLKAHSATGHKHRRVFDEHLVVKNTIATTKKKDKLCTDSILITKQSYELDSDFEASMSYGLSSMIRQKPNRKFIGTQPLLWFYNKFDTLRVKYVYQKNLNYLDEEGNLVVGGIGPDTLNIKERLEDSIVYRKSKIRKWAMTKLGQPPTVFDSAASKRTVQSMQNYLIQKGYLDAVVGYQVKFKKGKAFVSYYYNTGKPLLIDSLDYFSEDVAIQSILNDIKAGSKIKVGQPMDKSAFLEEKTRITLEIRNRGYQTFTWNYIAFEADTVNVTKPKGVDKKNPVIGERGEPRVNIYVQVLPYSDTLITHPRYTIRDVYVVLDEPKVEIHKIKRKFLMDTSFVVLSPPRKKEEISHLFYSNFWEDDSLTYLSIRRKAERPILEDISKKGTQSLLVASDSRYHYWLRMKPYLGKIPENFTLGKCIAEETDRLKFVFPRPDLNKSYQKDQISTRFLIDNPLNGKKYWVNLHPYRRRFVRKSYPEIHLKEEGEIPIHIILRKPAKSATNDSLEIKKLQKENFIIRDRIISRAVKIHSGSVYNYDASRLTMQKITELDVFTLPRVEYVPSKSERSDELDCYVFMRRAKKQLWRADAEINSSNANLGWATNLGYRNRNLFKGAEAFVFNVEGGIDFKLNNPDTFRTQNGIIRWINLLDVNTSLSLYFPKIVGFRNWSLSTDNNRTKVSLSYRYLQQSTDFRVSSFDALFGYEWTHKVRHHFTWSPFTLNFTLEPKLDPRFEEALGANNPAILQNLKDRYFIPGCNFTYRVNTNETSPHHRWSYRFFGETTGNSAWLTETILPIQEISLFQIPFSQYLKFDSDIRYTYIIDKKNSIATRIMAGMAMPYGNSSTVPYSRQFFLGGPSSMRGWNMRYLGPGRVRPKAGAEFQLGDIRLEMNAEYRFMLNSWIGGAFFVDAGNVWLAKVAQPTATTFPNRPEEQGKFTANFYKELAMDAGFGVRMDMSFFVIRVDVASQIRNPAGFEIKDKNGHSQIVGNNGLPIYWRFGPLNWVLAVGYPF